MEKLQKKLLMKLKTVEQNKKKVKVKSDFIINVSHTTGNA